MATGKDGCIRSARGPTAEEPEDESKSVSPAREPDLVSDDARVSRFSSARRV